MSQDLDERTRPADVDSGEHDRYSHYVPKDAIVQSAVTGRPVRALCGKVWVPSRDPERYPVCPTCKEILARLRGSGSGGDQP